MTKGTKKVYMWGESHDGPFPDFIHSPYPSNTQPILELNDDLLHAPHRTKSFLSVPKKDWGKPLFAENRHRVFETATEGLNPTPTTYESWLERNNINDIDACRQRLSNEIFLPARSFLMPYPDFLSHITSHLRKVLDKENEILSRITDFQPMTENSDFTSTHAEFWFCMIPALVFDINLVRLTLKTLKNKDIVTTYTGSKHMYALQDFLTGSGYKVDGATRRKGESTQEFINRRLSQDMGLDFMSRQP